MTPYQDRELNRRHSIHLRPVLRWTWAIIGGIIFLGQAALLGDRHDKTAGIGAVVAALVWLLPVIIIYLSEIRRILADNRFDHLEALRDRQASMPISSNAKLVGLMTKEEAEMVRNHERKQAASGPKP